MGVPIRLHVLLFLAVVAILAIDWHYRSFSPVLGSGIVTALAFLFCVFIHELAHVCARLNLGGLVHSVTLAPWGGSSHFDQPERPVERMIVHAAGPLANLMLFAIGASMLVGAGHVQLADLINPFSPRPFVLGEWEISLVGILAWVNFQLFLFNLIPCFPMDGFEFLRAVFTATNPHASSLKIESTLMAVGQMTGVALIVLSIIFRDFNVGPVQPVWSLMVAGGIGMLFASRFEYRNRLREMFRAEGWDTDDDELSHDSDLLFDSSNEPWFQEEQYSQWLTEKHLDIGHTDESVAAVTESLDADAADEILGKLHREGLESLTPDEHRFLERFSQQLRKRRSSPLP